MHDTADFRAVIFEKGAKLFGRNQIGQPTLGDITPFKGVRAQPINDDESSSKESSAAAMFEPMKPAPPVITYIAVSWFAVLENSRSPAAPP